VSQQRSRCVCTRCITLPSCCECARVYGGVSSAYARDDLTRSQSHSRRRLSRARRRAARAPAATRTQCDSVRAHVLCVVSVCSALTSLIPALTHSVAPKAVAMRSRACSHSPMCTSACCWLPITQVCVRARAVSPVCVRCHNKSRMHTACASCDEFVNALLLLTTSVLRARAMTVTLCRASAQ
jgi:hypothetical protein